MIRTLIHVAAIAAAVLAINAAFFHRASITVPLPVMYHIPEDKQTSFTYHVNPGDVFKYDEQYFIVPRGVETVTVAVFPGGGAGCSRDLNGGKTCIAGNVGALIKLPDGSFYPILNNGTWSLGGMKTGG